MNKARLGYLQLLFFSIFIGSVGIFVKLIEGIDVYGMIFFRYAIGALFILTFVLFRKKFSELRLVQPGRTLLLGLTLGMASILYFYAIVHTTVANAVFLLYTAPIFSLIIARVMLGEKLKEIPILPLY